MYPDRTLKKTLQELHRSGLSHAALARKFGVSRQRIHQVLGKASFCAMLPGNRKLDEAKVRELRQLRGEGASVIALAQRFGISRTTVWSVVTGRSWAGVDEPLPGPSAASQAAQSSQRPWSARLENCGRRAGASSALVSATASRAWAPTAL
ncbi:MAG: biotin operon repressor [Gammaproteobacteria bacterium]|jgi:biotin operon repressor